MKIILKDTTSEKFSHFKNKILGDLSPDIKETDKELISKPGSVLPSSIRTVLDTENNEVEIVNLNSTKVSIDDGTKTPEDQNVGFYNEKDVMMNKLNERNSDRTVSSNENEFDEFVIPVDGSADFLRLNLSHLAYRLQDRVKGLLKMETQYFDEDYIPVDVFTAGNKNPGANIPDDSSKFVEIINDSESIRKLHGIYKVEGTTCKYLQADFFIRGIPIPFKKIKTSEYIEDGETKYNFFFIYPYYLINHFRENFEAIKKVRFYSDSTVDGTLITTGAPFYKQTKASLVDTLSNVNIMNQRGRNIFSNELDIRLSPLITISENTDTGEGKEGKYKIEYKDSAGVIKKTVYTSESYSEISFLYSITSDDTNLSSAIKDAKITLRDISNQTDIYEEKIELPEEKNKTAEETISGNFSVENTYEITITIQGSVNTEKRKIRIGKGVQVMFAQAGIVESDDDIDYEFISVPLDGSDTFAKFEEGTIIDDIYIYVKKDDNINITYIPLELAKELEGENSELYSELVKNYKDLYRDNGGFSVVHEETGSGYKVYRTIFDGLGDSALILNYKQPN